jgi:hypothetical protein
MFTIQQSGFRRPKSTMQWRKPGSRRCTTTSTMDCTAESPGSPEGELKHIHAAMPLLLTRESLFLDLTVQPAFLTNRRPHRYGSSERNRSHGHGTLTSTHLRPLFLARYRRSSSHTHSSIATHICAGHAQASHIARPFLPGGVPLPSATMSQLGHLRGGRDVSQL